MKRNTELTIERQRADRTSKRWHLVLNIGRSTFRELFSMCHRAERPMVVLGPIAITCRTRTRFLLFALPGVRSRANQERSVLLVELPPCSEVVIQKIFVVVVLFDKQSVWHFFQIWANK